MFFPVDDVEQIFDLLLELLLLSFEDSVFFVEVNVFVFDFLNFLAEISDLVNFL